MTLDPFTLLSNDLGPLRPSDTHYCGFTLDLVITVNCDLPESTCKHPTFWSLPPTILLSSLDLSYLEFQTYGSKSQLDNPTWMSDRQLTCNISKTELLSSPLPPKQLPWSSGHPEPGIDQNWNHLWLLSLSWPISNLLANTLGSTFKTCLKYKYNLSKISCKPWSELPWTAVTSWHLLPLIIVTILNAPTGPSQLPAQNPQDKGQSLQRLKGPQGLPPPTTPPPRYPPHILHVSSSLRCHLRKIFPAHVNSNWKCPALLISLLLSVLLPKI